MFCDSKTGVVHMCLVWEKQLIILRKSIHFNLISQFYEGPVGLSQGKPSYFFEIKLVLEIDGDF